MDDRNRSDYLHEVAWLASELPCQQVLTRAFVGQSGTQCQAKLYVGQTPYFTQEPNSINCVRLICEVRRLTWLSSDDCIWIG